MYARYYTNLIDSFDMMLDLNFVLGTATSNLWKDLCAYLNVFLFDVMIMVMLINNLQPASIKF